MTKLKILQTAVAKAIANGWIPTQFQAADMPYIDKTWPTVVYDHSFARALWGDTPEGDIGPQEVATLDFPDGSKKTLYTYHPWQEHLQAMVIAEDPIKYLGDNS